EADRRLGEANDQLAEAGRRVAAREYQLAALEHQLAALGHQLAAAGNQLAQAAAREKYLDEQLAALPHSAHLIREDRDALARRIDRLRQSFPGRLYRLARRLRGR